MFWLWSETIELLASGAAVSPDQARRWMIDVVRSDAVRLKKGDIVQRYSELPEIGAARSARMATHQKPAARYNPFARSRGERPVPSKPMLPAPGALLARCAVHLGDLEKAISREFQVDAALSEVASRSAVSNPLPATGVAPITQLLEFFRERGQQPEFRDVPQERWLHVAAERGLQFVGGDFDAAWRMASEQGFVVPLKGAPKRDQQNKRVAVRKAVPTSADASIPIIAVVSKKATGT